MNGDVNLWERGETGGAKGFYDKDGNYIGFTSQDGSWWPNVPGTAKPGTNSPAPAGVGGPWGEDKFKPCQDPALSDLQRGLCIIGIDPLAGLGATGTNIITNPVGSIAKGAGIALELDWMKAAVIILVGALVFWTGLQGLMKPNG